MSLGLSKTPILGLQIFVIKGEYLSSKTEDQIPPNKQMNVCPAVTSSFPSTFVQLIIQDFFPLINI